MGTLAGSVVIALTALSEANWLTAARVRRIGVVFAVMAVIFFSADVWLHTRAGVTDASGEQLGRDFVNYWAGARMAAEHRAPSVYDVKAFVSFQRAHTSAHANFKWYSYPPMTLLLSLPLAIMSFKAGFAFWLVAGWAACTALLKRMLNWPMAALAGFATPASFLNALSGQNGQFSAALLCGGVLMLGSRPLVAGTLFGLLCFKPHLAVLVPVALAAGGYWRAFGAAAFTALAITAVSALLFGQDTWAAFLHNAPINALLMEQGTDFWHRMPTVFAMIRLAGGNIALAYGVQIASALVAAFLTARIWRSQTTIARKGAALVLATFLTTPYAWDYDLVSLTFVAAWLVADGLQNGFRSWEKLLLAITVAMPLIITSMANQSHIQIAPLILGGMLLQTLRGAATQNQNRLAVA
ncbi:MAG: glycosyltransferase family 87 protein [Pseudomonadota bacterium]